MSENLKKIREALGFAPDEFRMQLGIENQPTYYRYENGDRKIPDAVMLALFVKFKVNLNFLIMGEGEMFLAEQIKPVQLPYRASAVDEMCCNECDRLDTLQKYNGKSDGEMSEILNIEYKRYLRLLSGDEKLKDIDYDSIKSNFDVNIDDLRYDEKGLFDKLKKELEKQQKSFEKLSPEQREKINAILKES